MGTAPLKTVAPSVHETGYRIPDARKIRVNRANLTRFTLHEPQWDAWCDSIRVLADRDLNRLTDTAHCNRMASPAGDGAVLATIPIVGRRELESGLLSA